MPRASQASYARGTRSQPVTEDRAQPAVTRSRGTRRAAAGIAALALAADQASKSLVLAAHPGGGASGDGSGGGLVSVRLVRNSGASFGIGAGHPLLITLTAVVVLALAVVLLTRVRSRAAALALGAVAGGAAGNLADRLLRGPGLGRGSVVDWIHLVGYPATFNVADIAIRLGAVCALIAVLRARPRPGPSEALPITELAAGSGTIDGELVAGAGSLQREMIGVYLECG
jgi:signal peptidase II